MAREVGVSHEALVAANPDVFDPGFFKRMCFGGVEKSWSDPDDYVLRPGIVLNIPKEA